MDPEVLVTLPLWFAIFLLSTVCHEAAHALAARIGGDSTAHDGGQVSLDPIPHVRRHPMGMLVFPLVTFLLNGGRWMIGWASAPYDPVWAARFPRRAALMAAAGPAANLALVLVAGLGIAGGVAAGWFEAPESPRTDRVVAMVGGGTHLATIALSVLFSLNLLLFSFNLLPLPPLDGSAVLGLVLPRRLHEQWQEQFREPMFGLIGLLVAWQVFGWVWPALFSTALAVLHPDVTYVAR